MEPRVEALPVPPAYGTRAKDLEWSWVREQLEQALRYWLITTRRDGTAHAVPVDGLWVGDLWYHGGVAQTVHHRNLVRNPEAVVHLESTESVVVVEGTVIQHQPTEAFANQLEAASKAKYGYSPGAAVYLGGVMALTPRRARGWSAYPGDATRFMFDGN